MSENTEIPVVDGSDEQDDDRKICGAMTQTGEPCKNPPVTRNGRCHLDQHQVSPPSSTRNRSKRGKAIGAFTTFVTAEGGDGGRFITKGEFTIVLSAIFAGYLYGAAVAHGYVPHEYMSIGSIIGTLGLGGYGKVKAEQKKGVKVNNKRLGALIAGTLFSAWYAYITIHGFHMGIPELIGINASGK